MIFRTIKVIQNTTTCIVLLVLASSCSIQQPNDFSDLSIQDFLTRDMATQNRPALQVYLLEQMETRAPSQDTALASHYFTGIGTDKNEKRAQELFMSAADKGDTKAQLCLSMIYLKSRKLVDTMKWLEIASDANNKYSKLAIVYKNQFASKLSDKQICSAHALAEAWKSKYKITGNEKVP